MSRIKRLLGIEPARAEWFCRSGAPHPDAREPDDLELIYLGTAGFVVRSGARTVVLDPFVSRPNALRTLALRLVPDAARIAQYLPHADDVLVGHAHHDHILDAPELCKRSGARLIGSRAAIMVGRAAGVPEAQLRETSGHEDIASGAWTVRPIPSRHGKVFGRVPLPGDIEAPPPWPPRLTDLRHGLVLNWLVNTGGLTLAHVDSADFVNEELRGMRCDVLCLCAIGRQARTGYTQEIISLLKPRWVVPCHWDTMLTPIDAPAELIPGVDLPGFVREIRAAGATPLLTPLLGKLRFAAQRPHPLG